MSKPQPPATRRFSLGIRQKLALTFALTIFLIMLVTVYLITVQEKDASLTRATENGLMLGSLLAKTMGEDIVRADYRTLDNTLKDFTQHHSVKYCAILSNTGRIIATTNPDNRGKFASDGWTLAALARRDISIRRARYADELVYDAAIPVIIADYQYGSIRFGFSLAREYEHIRKALLYNLGLGLFFIFIAIILAYSLSSSFLWPISNLMLAAEKVGRGDLSFRARIRTYDEFEVLAGSFNQMTDSLRRKEELRKFISSAAWEAIENSQGTAVRSGQKQEVAVLFSDIVGFTNFVERNDPEDVVEHVNAYFDLMVSAITQAGGIIDKFVGDCIMGVFLHTPKHCESPEFRSVLATLLMRQNLADFNYRQSIFNHEEFHTGIGVNAGNAVLGNFGAASRLEYSVLGDTVNIAARLESESRSGHSTCIFVGQSVVQRLAGRLVTISHGERLLKGKSQPIEIFELLGLDNLPLLIETFRGTTDPAAQQQALTLIGFCAGTEAESFLLDLFSHQPDLRFSLFPPLKWLCQQQRRATIDYLRNLAATEQDPHLLATILSTLAQTRTPELVSLFRGFLEHGDDRVRANAMEALLPLKYAEKPADIRAIAQDPTPRVAANALLGMWQGGAAQTLDLLLEMVTSTNSGTRTAGAYSCAVMATSRRFRMLFAHDAENSALPTFDFTRVRLLFDSLTACLDSSEVSERRQAGRAVAALNLPHADKVLVEYLQREKDPQIFQEIANILESHGFIIDSPV